jgi:RHS repeat-associated protein
MAFEKNAANQIERTIDREGGQTQISYHAGSGKIASATNARNKGMTYTYTAQEQTFADPVTPANQVTFTFYNLTRVDYPDGTYETFTHDDKGNILSHTDPANTHPEGTPWIYTYNEKGQVQTRENPEGGVTTFTYNNDGTLASVTDTDTGQTSYGHDGFKRLTGITRPDSGTVEIQYDLNDRITVVTDERNNTYTYTYDANGNLAEITDPDNNKTEFTHDKMDRVSGTTDARTQASQFTYDIMNRLKKATDPNTSTLEYGYDTRGWLNSVTDGQGYAWTTGHDKEGLPITRTTPLGRTATITRDALGQIIEQIDPQGNKTTFNRDDASRVTRITDPEDRETVYAYDDAGRLTGVTLPDNKTSQYRRNGLGLVDRITDRGGSQWHLDYTGMGRLAALTDPLNNKWEYTYDTTGRPETVTFPDGSVLTRTHDKAGNLTKNRYTDGQGQALDLEFTWDKHNRLLTAENIAFSYNETGQITTTTNPGTAFGAAYDNGGRLITATYANGLFSVTYTYNARNLLTRVTDSLTNAAIDFTYDNDSRLTGMTRSGGSGASGTDTTFTWDDASRLTRIQHGTLADLSYTLNKAGDITQLTYTLPLDPADYLATDIGTLAFDAGSQITSAGYGYGAQGRQTQSPYDTFTWDKASRITAISQTNLAYNGLNDLLTRQADGTTVRFYYNYALGLEPAVAEKNETAQAWKRFYILTPAGQLLYLIDASNSNAVSFYHFDRTGNTLFLTDETGNITDCYAYSPYGKLLAHSGTSDQPYTFAGAWQARKEGDNGIYQMRARYYDAGTARFLSRESQWPVIHEPHDLNPYQYARMNPVMYVDPEGTAPEPAGEERIGLKIGFSEKYACPVHKIWLDQLIQRRKELREAIEKLGLMGGWSRTRIDNEIKKELQEATWDLSNFQKAIVLKKGEGIDLNAVKIVEGLSGQFGQARWFAERHGERVFLGEGNTLRLDQEQVQQLKDHFGSDVNIVLESDYSDQEGTDTFTQKANAVFDGF